MNDQEIIERVQEEIELQTLGATEQFLEILELVSDGTKYKVERIDRENTNGVARVYMPVKDQVFYLVVYVDTKKAEVTGVGTEPFHQVYFRATSEELDSAELTSMTMLQPTESWNKGDLRQSGPTKHTFSSIMFLPNPEPDTFENKLGKLLDFLEQDKEGIKRLVESAHGYIQVAMEFHYGNGMIGGPTINKESIKRMNELNLEIEFDLYIDGNPFK